MLNLMEIVAMEVVAKDEKKPKESKEGKVWFFSHGGSRSYGTIWLFVTKNSLGPKPDETSRQ